MPYGTIKVDNIVFTNSGVDQTIGVSGLVQSVSGNLTASGTISGNLIRGNTVSGATITGGVLTVASGIFSSGTVSAPSIGFTGDSNTGFWTPAGDTVALSTGGSERMRLDSFGDLGIGTTDPTSRLTVRADATSGPNTIIRVENRALSAGVTTQNIKIEGIFDYNNGTSDASAGAIVFGKEGTYTTATTNNDSYLALETVLNNTSVERLRITSDGNVGVGTVAPRSVLDVTGTSSISWVGGANATKGLLTVGTQGTSGGSLFVHTPSLSASFGAGFAVDGTYSNPGGIGTAIVNLKALGVYSGGGYDSALAFHTSVNTTSSEKVRITSDGKVGIGTSSPNENLSVSGTAAAAVVLGIDGPSGQVSRLQFKRANTNRFKIECDTSDNLLFYSDASTAERARIDSSGRLLVGTNTSVVVGAAASQGQIQIADTAVALQSITTYANSVDGPYLIFGKSRGASVPSYTIVQNNDQLGTIRFAGSNGTNLGVVGASIVAFSDGTPGLASMPGRLVFSTTADGAASPTERLRIDSSGNVGIGNTTPLSRLDVRNDSISVGQSTNVNGTYTLLTGYGYTTGGLVYGNTSIRSTYNAASNAASLEFYTASGGLTTTERMRIDSSGNVGIGTSSTTTQRFAISGPSADPLLTLLENTSGSTARLRVYADNTTGITLNATNTALAGKDIIFTRGASTESARIDSSGRLLVGTSTSRNTYTSSSGLLQIEGTTNSSRSQTIIHNANDTTDPLLVLGKSRSTVVGGNTAVLVGDFLGRVAFHGANGTTLLPAAHVIAGVDTGTVSATSMPGYLGFWTTADGASSPVERMKINSAGRVGIGTTSPDARLEIDNNLAGAVSEQLRLTNLNTANGSGSSIFFKGFYNLAVITGVGNPTSFTGGDLRLQTYSNDSTLNTGINLTRTGLVGIGTTSPRAVLDATATAVGAVTVPLVVSNGDNSASGTGAGIGFVVDGINNIIGAQIEGIRTASTNHPSVLAFKTRDAGGLLERARIDSAGRLLHGTTASRLVVGTATAQIETTTGYGLSIVNNANSGVGSLIVLGKSRGTAAGAVTTVIAGDILGYIRFSGADGTDMANWAAEIRGEVEGTVGTNITPGRLIFGTAAAGAGNTTERMRIDSSGNVGIGTASPATRLDVASTADAGGIKVSGLGSPIGTNGPAITFANVNNSLVLKDISFIKAPMTAGGVGSEGGGLAFGTAISGAAAVERMRVTQDGYLRMTVNGNGIQFNGDTAATNALNDYEEGTFTPTIVGTTLAGTGTYSAQVGRYTKVGNLVRFQVAITWSAHTGTGNLRVAGLPFVNVNVIDAQSPAAVAPSNLTFSNSLSAFTVQNSPQVLFRTYATGGAEADLPIDTAASIRVAGVYEAA